MNYRPNRLAEIRKDILLRGRKGVPQNVISVVKVNDNTKILNDNLPNIME